MRKIRRKFRFGRYFICRRMKLRKQAFRNTKPNYPEKGYQGLGSLLGPTRDDQRLRSLRLGVPRKQRRLGNDDDRVFSHSPKTRHIQEAKAQEEGRGSVAPLVSRDTRSIAALAASRRQRLATIPQQSPPSAATDAYLTPSRLAKHDRSTGSWGNLRFINSDDQMSVGTNDRNSNWTDQRTNRSDKFGYGRTSETKKKARSKSFEPSLGEVQLNSNGSNSRKAGEVRPNARRQPPAPLNSRSRSKNSYAAQLADRKNEVREFESSSQSSSTVYQIAPEKGKGLALQRNVRNAKAADPSPVGTPQKEGRRARKPPPTIPPYKKAEVGIVGYAIAR